MPNISQVIPCTSNSTPISVPSTHSPDHGKLRVKQHAYHNADQSAKRHQPPAAPSPGGAVRRQRAERHRWREAAIKERTWLPTAPCTGSSMIKMPPIA